MNIPQLFILLSVLLLSGCVSNAAPDQMVVSPMTEVIVTNTSPPSQTVSSEPSSTTTSSPTFTTPPTLTPAPTNTPTSTMMLPARLPELFPKPDKPIGANNITEIRELGYHGTPLLQEMRYTTNREKIYEITSVGIRVYDAINLELIRYFPIISCSQRYVSCSSSEAVSISSDGTRFAILTDEYIQVWDLGDDKLFEIPIDGNLAYHSISLSPNGIYLAVAINEAEFTGGNMDNKVSVYDIATGEIIGLPAEHYSRCKFSPGGTWLVIYNDSNRNGTMWRTKDWTKYRDIFFASNDRKDIEFSPDDRYIVMQSSLQTSIYQIEEWRLRREFSIINDKAKDTRGFYFSPSTDLFAVLRVEFNSSKRESNWYARVWNLNNGERLSDIPFGSEAPLQIYTLFDDGVFAEDETLKNLYSYFYGNEYVPWWKWTLSKIVVSDDGGVLRTWKYQWNIRLETRLNEICTLKFGDEHNCVTSSESIFLTDNGEYYLVRPGQMENTYEIYQEYDGSGPLIGRYRSQISNMAHKHLFLTDDKEFLIFMAIVSDNYFITDIWNIKTEKRVNRWFSYPYLLDIDQESGLAAISFSDLLLVYDYRENHIVYKESLSYHREGQIILSADGNIIRMTNVGSPEWGFRRILIDILDYSTMEQKPITELTITEYMIDAVVLSPDGRLLVVGTPDGYIRTFDVISGNELFAWQAHNRCISSLKFISDGKLLVSHSLGCANGGDGLLKIWGIWP
jgi:WD40 repeat protein